MLDSCHLITSDIHDQSWLIAGRDESVSHNSQLVVAKAELVKLFRVKSATRWLPKVSSAKRKGAVGCHFLDHKIATLLNTIHSRCFSISAYFL